MSAAGAMSWRSRSALALTILFWGTSFLGVRLGLQSFGPAELACLRFVTASAVLLAWGVVQPIPLPRGADWGRIGLLGLLGISVYHLLMNWGQQTVMPGTTALILQTSPVFTAILTHFMGVERLTRLAVTGIAVAFSGTVLLILGQGRTLDFTLGALAILLASVAASVFFVLQQGAVKKYGARATTTWSMVAGTLPLLLWSPTALEQWHASSTVSRVALVYIGVFPAAIAYILWNYAISQVGPTRASVFLYLSPVVAMLTTWFWYGAAPPLVAVGGGAVTVVGVYLVNVARQRSRRLATGNPG